MDKEMEEMEALVQELPGSAREIWGEAFRKALEEVQGNRSKAAAMAWRAFRKPEIEGSKRAGRKTAAQGLLMVAVRGGTPEWVRVLGSDGLVLKEGRYPCCVDRRSLQAIVGHWEQGGRVLRIGRAEAEAEAGMGRAAGWIQELNHRQEGLWIRVEWTEKALADIWGKGPAYLGLKFILDEDQKPVELRQASLSCFPLINLWPVSEEGGQDLEEKQSLDKFQCHLVGQVGSQAATEYEENRHVAQGEKGTEVKKLAEFKKVVAGLMDSCGLPGDVAAEEVGQVVLGAFSRKPGQVQGWRPESDTGLAQVLETAMETRIAEAVARGWLKPEQRDWARVYAYRDRKGFEEFLELAAGALGMNRKWPWRWLLFWRRFFR